MDIVKRLRDYEAIAGTALPKLCGEAADEIERLRAAYDSRGGEMDSMRMVLAQTQKWNEDRLAEIKRLQDALDTCRELRLLDKADEVKRLQKANAR